MRSRKVRRFGDRIRELHAQGYSLETIRETLAEAGIVVSKSTVQREAARRPTQSPSTSAPTHTPIPVLRAAAEAPVAEQGITPPPQTANKSAAPLHQSGKEIAEAFFEGRISNPLLRKDKR